MIVNTLRPPQIEQILQISQVVFRARKKAFRTVDNSERKTESKQNTLEASDLRAFNKLYIISNQQYINIIVMLCTLLHPGELSPLGPWGREPRATDAPAVTPLH